MPKIILKSPYLKPRAKTHIANHIKYIATREGAERPEDSTRQLPATQFQQTTVADLLKEYPDTAELHEYTDYREHPTRTNADAFILAASETHPELLGGREKYVDYIANRPGVVRIAEHGLFSDADKVVRLAQVMDDVANHGGNIWCHIISLRREDAERLGYEDVGKWQELLKQQRNIIAKQMGITPANFRWYAAFHNKDHHPHVHLVAYSANPKEGYLTVHGIEQIKSSLARRIFRSDNDYIYQRQTEHRDALRQDSRVIAAEIVSQINAGTYENPLVRDLLLQLAESLKDLPGKKQYGYLKQDVKSTVDRIVDELAKDERLSRLYDLWYEQKEKVIRTYTDTMPTRLPLSQNDEFKPVKNAVINEAMNIALDRLVFEDIAETEPDEEPADAPVVEQEPETPSAENKYVLYRRAKALLDKDSPDYDPPKAVPLLIQSAEQDYEWAQYRLGKMFLQGDGVPQDVDYGLKWLWKADAQHNEYAQILLARTYLKSELVEQDIGKAETLFGFAADNGNADAQYALAKLHLNSQAENPSVTLAVELLGKSAAGGNEWAQYTLGKLLMQGEIVPKDMARAEKLLLQAVQPRRSRDSSRRTLPGNQYAAYLLGKMYLSEDGIPKDAAKAVRYLSDSAAQGNQWAQYQLGKMLLYGKEVKPDVVQGLSFLTASANQGNVYAAKVIENYYSYHSKPHGDAVLGSLRLLGHLARLMQNRLDEEARRDGQMGLVDRKLRRQIEIKREAHGLRGYE